jgi:hypothetical protein
MGTKMALLGAGALLGVVFLRAGPLAGSGPAAGQPKADERIERLEKRLAQLEKQLADLVLALKDRPRHQMLNAGAKVVILDTQSGRSEVVQPAEARRYQPVAVGDSLFVVDTQTGTITQRRGK